MEVAYSEHKARRLRAFFEGLQKGNNQITEELIQQDDQIHAILCTLDAAHRAASADKALRLGTLCASYQLGQVAGGLSELEEVTALVADLSEREWMSLLILERWNILEGSHGFENMTRDRDRVRDELTSTLQLDEEELESFFRRLERTGLVRLIGASIAEVPKWTPFVSPKFTRIRNYVESFDPGGPLEAVRG
jgi:hypothetical protein